MSQYPPPHVPYAAPGIARRTSGLAIAALVLGILGMCVPLLGIIGIILGAIAISQTSRPEVGGRGLAIAGLVLGIVGTLFVVLQLAILLPSLNRARETANRVKCASNMRQIGTAFMLYANENRGALPPDLATAMSTQALPVSVFVCPSGKNTAAAFTNDVAARAAGNLDYIYTGEGMTNSASADDPILFEMLSDHRGDGGNVMFGDGHVEWLPKANMLALFNKLAGTPRVTAEESAAMNKP